MTLNVINGILYVIKEMAYYIHVAVKIYLFYFQWKRCHLLYKLDAIYRLMNYRVGLSTLYLT